jgi:PAS domain S-box-containing protein
MAVALAHVLEAMVDAVFLLDADGGVKLANTAAERITEYARTELQAMPIGLLLQDDRSGLRTGVRKRIERGDVLRREESWIVTKGGDHIPVSVTGAPVFDESGVLQGIVLVVRDMREARQLLADKENEIVRTREVEAALRTTMASTEDRLEQARTQLLLAERRATLGTLAGGVGHELRNIAQIQVSAIDTLLIALEHHEDVTELARAALPDLERVGEHIHLHAKRLMQLARPGADHVSPIDLNSVVREVAAMLQSAGRLRRIDVSLVLGDAPLMVTVNRTRIEQILVNLIVNAADALGADRRAITIVVKQIGSRAVCEVTDTGSGIPDDVIGRIFEPFYTTKPQDVGTGLGLPVAREIVQSYGGGLAVRSTVGRGTTFTFDLPING